MRAIRYPRLKRPVSYRVREAGETLCVAFWVGVLLLVRAVDLAHDAALRLWRFRA